MGVRPLNSNSAPRTENIYEKPAEFSTLNTDEDYEDAFADVPCSPPPTYTARFMSDSEVIQISIPGHKYSERADLSNPKSNKLSVWLIILIVLGYVLLASLCAYLALQLKQASKRRV